MNTVKKILVPEAKSSALRMPRMQAPARFMPNDPPGALPLPVPASSSPGRRKRLTVQRMVQ